MKLTVTAKDGTEAVVAVFGGGSLPGEGCIDSEAARRTHSAEALSDSQITEFTKGSFVKAIKQDPLEDDLRAFLFFDEPHSLQLASL
jgi:CRP-like cAMP-binding protein